MLVDVHTHFMAKGLIEALEGRTEMPRIAEVNGRAEIQYGPGNGHELYPEMVDIDLQLERMATAGIDFAVLSANVPGVDWFEPADGLAVAREVNDELAELSRSHADRLAALALLPMQSPEAAADELARAVGEGLKGGLVFSNVAGVPLDEERFEVVFSAAADLGVPVLIHPTYPLCAEAMDAYALISTVGFLTDTTTAALRLVLGGVFERHPRLRLHLPHAGSLLPQLAGRIDNEASRLPGGMGKLTVAPSEQLRLIYTDCVCDWPPALRNCLELFGEGRVMFGSDFPFWRADSALATVEGAGLDAGVVEAIESRTAIECFNLEPDAGS